MAFPPTTSQQPPITLEKLNKEFQKFKIKVQKPLEPLLENPNLLQDMSKIVAINEFRGFDIEEWKKQNSESWFSDEVYAKTLQEFEGSALKKLLINDLKILSYETVSKNSSDESIHSTVLINDSNNETWLFNIGQEDWDFTGIEAFNLSKLVKEKEPINSKNTFVGIPQDYKEIANTISKLIEPRTGFAAEKETKKLLSKLAR